MRLNLSNAGPTSFAPELVIKTMPPGFSFSQRCPGFHPIYLNSLMPVGKEGVAFIRQPAAPRLPLPDRERLRPGNGIIPCQDPSAAREGRAQPELPLSPCHGAVSYLGALGLRAGPAACSRARAPTSPPGWAGLGWAGRPKARTTAACSPRLTGGAVPVGR